MEGEALDWTGGAWNASKLQAVVLSVMKYRDPQKAGHFSFSCAKLTCSRMIILHKNYFPSLLRKA